MPRKTSPSSALLSPAALAFVAGRFRLLSDPTRLALLQALHDGELSVGQLVARTRGNQGNVSKHLGLLAAAHLVRKRRAGNFAYYSISDPVVFELCDLMCRKLSDQLASQLAALARSGRGKTRGRR